MRRKPEMGLRCRIRLYLSKNVVARKAPGNTCLRLSAPQRYWIGRWVSRALPGHAVCSAERRQSEDKLAASHNPISGLPLGGMNPKAYATPLRNRIEAWKGQQKSPGPGAGTSVSDPGHCLPRSVDAAPTVGPVPGEL